MSVSGSLFDLRLGAARALSDDAIRLNLFFQFANALCSGLVFGSLVA
jgi:hypothetical protein